MTLVYLAVSWIAGVWLAGQIPIPWQALAICAFLCLTTLVALRPEGRWRQGLLCLLFACLGAGRLLLAQPRLDERHIAAYNDAADARAAVLTGVVVGEPDVREQYVNLRVRVSSLTPADGAAREVRGIVLVKGPRYPAEGEFEYGDRVRVTGALETPPVFEEFSYRDYLARQGIHSLIQRAAVSVEARNQANPLLYHLFRFKRQAQRTIAAILPEPHAALLTGILLGVESGIPPDLAQAFSDTGTSHIIAISGFNITIVAGLFAGLAGRVFRKRTALWVAIGGVCAYTVLVGASAAVVRAAVMGGIVMVARLTGRESHAPTALAAAALVMTAVNPYWLWDVGFQLSFAATLGLLLYATPLNMATERWLARRLPPRYVRPVMGVLGDALLVSLAAQITTTPLIVYYFRRLSLVTLLTNLLVLPAQPAVMMTGGLAMLTGLLYRPLGQVVGWIAWLFLAYTIEVVRLTARVPFASIPLYDFGPLLLIGYYALLGMATWRLSQPADRRAGGQARIPGGRAFLGAAGVTLALLVIVRLSLPDGRLHVVFLDVGQGDAIYIQTPAGRQVLVDGGPSERQLLSQLGRRMPFWDRSLDLVVLTHPDSDHVTGLIPVLERYQVGAMLWRPIDFSSPQYHRYQEIAAERGIPAYDGLAGVEIDLGDGVQMRVLSPGPTPYEENGEDDPNNNSIVALLRCGEISFLLTGDAEEPVEQALLAAGAAPRVTVLKAGHHGSRSSTGAAFLRAADPQIVVISAGLGNRFGHPDGATLARLRGRDIYRTDMQGAIEFVSDCRTVQVRTER